MNIFHFLKTKSSKGAIPELGAIGITALAVMAGLGTQATVDSTMDNVDVDEQEAIFSDELEIRTCWLGPDGTQVQVHNPSENLVSTRVTDIYIDGETTQNYDLSPYISAESSATLSFDEQLPYLTEVGIHIEDHEDNILCRYDGALSVSTSQSPADLEEGDTVTVEAEITSEATVEEIEWSFNSETYTDTEEITETLEDPGTYPGTIEIEDSLENTAETGFTVEVDEIEDQDPFIDADFTISDSSPLPGDNIDFEDDTTVENDNVVDYSWYMGDGTSSSGETVTHSYSTTGDYIVSLTVEGEETSDTEEKTVSVSSIDADMDWTPEQPDPGTEVTFTDESNAENSYVDSWTWTIEDQGEFTSEEATVEWDSEGTYDVELEVENNYGHSDTVSGEVEVVDEDAEVTYELDSEDDWDDGDGDDVEYESLKIADNERNIPYWVENVESTTRRGFDAHKGYIIVLEGDTLTTYQDLGEESALVNEKQVNLEGSIDDFRIYGDTLYIVGDEIYGYDVSSPHSPVHLWTYSDFPGNEIAMTEDPNSNSIYVAGYETEETGHSRHGSLIKYSESSSGLSEDWQIIMEEEHGPEREALSADSDGIYMGGFYYNSGVTNPSEEHMYAFSHDGEQTDSKYIRPDYGTEYGSYVFNVETAEGKIIAAYSIPNRAFIMENNNGNLNFLDGIDRDGLKGTGNFLRYDNGEILHVGPRANINSYEIQGNSLEATYRSEAKLNEDYDYRGFWHPDEGVRDEILSGAGIAVDQGNVYFMSRFAEEFLVKMDTDGTEDVHEEQGSYTGDVFDAGTETDWRTLLTEQEGLDVGSGLVTVEVSDEQSFDNVLDSQEFSLSGSSSEFDLSVQDSRYLRVKVELGTGDRLVSPKINNLRVEGVQ